MKRNLAAPAPKVEPAAALPAARRTEDDQVFAQLVAERVQQSEAPRVDAPPRVEPATAAPAVAALDAENNNTSIGPISEIANSSLVERADKQPKQPAATTVQCSTATTPRLSVEALREQRGGRADFEGYAAILQGTMPTDPRKKWLPCLFGRERDFVTFGEAKRYAVVVGSSCFVFGEHRDPSPFYAVPLEEVYAIQEDPFHPDPSSVTVSPLPGEPRSPPEFVTILLKNKSDHSQAYQFTFDTRDDPSSAKHFWDAVRRSGGDHGGAVTALEKVKPRLSKSRKRARSLAGLLTACVLMMPTLAVTALSLHSHDNIDRRLLIVGLGRVGMEVATQALESRQFEHVVGTLRRIRQERDVDLDNSFDQHVPTDGIERCWFDSLQREHVEASTHILFTIPAPDYDAREIIDSVVLPSLVTDPSPGGGGGGGGGAMSPRSKWIGIISSTGVYGNHEGAWVTEKSACLCDANTSAGRLLEFEAYWKQLVARGQLRSRVRIFRCAGIYGNTRSALHTVFRQGHNFMDPDRAANNDVTNRIHEEDLAAAVHSSMLQDDGCDSPQMGDVQTFNVADDLPESRRTVMDHAVRLFQEIGVDVSVGFDGGTKVGTGRSSRRAQDRKLVSNKKMKDALLPALRYPTYREGLSQIVKHPGAPWNLQSPGGPTEKRAT